MRQPGELLALKGGDWHDVRVESGDGDASAGVAVRPARRPSRPDVAGGRGWGLDGLAAEPVTVVRDAPVYVGGHFTRVGGQARSHLAASRAW